MECFSLLLSGAFRSIDESLLLPLNMVGCQALTMLITVASFATNLSVNSAGLNPCPLF